MNTIMIMIKLLGGLAMFLYGMEIMGDGLKQGSGNALKNILGKLTGNVITGIITGTVVTAIIQSSTATIVLTVGLIGAGILNLRQAVSIVLGANIWTTNDNALYTGALGLANITGKEKKPMVIISGIIGTVAAMWLYNNFCNWLTILNATLPAVGVILIADFFMNRKKYGKEGYEPDGANWAAIIGVIAGAVVGNLTGGNIIPGFTFGIAAINNAVVSLACYFVGQKLAKK